MISKLPDNVIGNIKFDVKEKFNVDIDEDLIDFVQDFQSKVAVEEGFENKETVRLYNLAVFLYNPKRADSRNTMRRLLNKHGGDSKAALAEFRKLGKDIAINDKTARKEKRDNKVTRYTMRHPFKSKDGKFTAL